MDYTLITKSGQIFTFFQKNVAEIYQQAYGGTIMTKDVLTEVTQETVDQ